MKKINRSFLKKISVILVALLAVVGFSSCEPNEVEYGTPYVEFSVKEKVADQDE